MYHVYLYGSDAPDPSLLLGQPRPIRSDEFVQTTIQYLASYTGDPRRYDANNLLFPDVVAFTRAPMWHWRTLLRPPAWPAFLLPAEPAFALTWWLRQAMLVGAAYALFYRITRRDVALSTFGAVAILYAPYMQWFLNDIIVEFATCLFAALWLVLIIVETTGLRRAVAAALGLGYVTASCAMLIYVPHLIGVGLLGLALTVGLLLQRRSVDWSRRSAGRIALLACAPLALAVTLAIWSVEFNDTRRAVEQTVYPGLRRVAGGEMSLTWLFSSFFDVELLQEWQGPALGVSNQSETATFPLFAPFLAPLTLWSAARAFARRTRPADILGLAIVGYLTIALAWMLTGLPWGLGTLLLLDRVPAYRLLLPVGLVSTVYVVHALAHPRLILAGTARWYVTAATTASFVFHVWVGSELLHQPPFGIPKDSWIILVASVPAALTWALLSARRRLFVSGCLAATLVAGLPVNPVYHGLAPILGTPLSTAIREIDAADGDRPIWLAYNAPTFFLTPLLQANGARTYGLHQWYPRPEFWTIVDPDARYADEVNRYTTVNVFSDAPVGAPKITLFAANGIFLFLHPCDRILDALDVRYVVTVGTLDLPCLRLVRQPDVPAPGVTIYRRVSSP